MRYVDMHAHMVSRTTDDYQNMALTGCVAVTEPAFWAGWDRTSADSFEDYFRHLTEFEPKRAQQYGIQHFCWLCLNPKEGDDRTLTAEVLRRIPKYLEKPTVIGIGEIGVNRITRNEIATFRDHVELALEHNQLILIHTPHLEDKYKGTKVIVDALLTYTRLNPARVLVDHAEEHTIDMILSNGFYAGLTLYPQTKVSTQRAADIIEMYGPERICIASACDWGPSLPTALPHFMLEMRRRKHPESLIDAVVYRNPVRFLQQCTKFPIRLEESAGAPANIAYADQ